MKKLLKILLGLLGGLVLLLIAASVVLILILNKGMVEDQMKKALNRHVTIKEINVGIFSIVSGIEVNDVKISNYKTKKEIESLKGKPVGDVFVSLEAFRFKVKLLPLLKKQFVLRELALYKPNVNVVRDKNGIFNFDDLTKPKPMTAEERAELAKKQKEEAEKKKEDAKTKGKDEVFTADSIPVAISIGKVGLEKGVVNVHDLKFDQKFAIYNLTVLAHSITIDPKDLANKDDVKIKGELGIKTIGPMKTGSVKTFDIGLSVNGNVKPFDVKTRKLDPEAWMKVGSPYGDITGLQLFESMKSVDQLAKYTGKLDFLKKDQKWKDAYMTAWYKAKILKLQDGNLKNDEFSVLFGGWMNVDSKNIDYDLDMVLAEKHKESMRSGIVKNLKPLITGQVAKIVKPEKIADTAMDPLLNKDKQVYIKYKITGTMSQPNTKMIHPKLPSLKDQVTKAGGKLGDVVVDKAKEEVAKVVDKGTEKAKEEGKKEVKKAIKKLKF